MAINHDGPRMTVRSRASLSVPGMGGFDEKRPVGLEDAADDTRCWYVYGITHHHDLATTLATVDDADIGAFDDAPLQVLELSNLAVVARSMRVGEYRRAVTRDRSHAASDSDALVWRHNHVVQAIHEKQAILPAKVGVVYACAEDVVSALRPAHDRMVRQLLRVDACDEWAVHVYADRAVVRRRVAAQDPLIRRLRNERDGSHSSRAHVMEQRIRDEVDTATEQALLALTQRAFDRLVGYALAERVIPIARGSDPDAEVEILRVSLLVARNVSREFKRAVESIASMSDGLRCEDTGPWPPYSFADQDEDGE